MLMSLNASSCPDDASVYPGRGAAEPLPRQIAVEPQLLRYETPSEPAALRDLPRAVPSWPAERSICTGVAAFGDSLQKSATTTLAQAYQPFLVVRVLHVGLPANLKVMYMLDRTEREG